MKVRRTMKKDLTGKTIVFETYTHKQFGEQLGARVKKEEENKADFFDWFWYIVSMIIFVSFSIGLIPCILLELYDWFWIIGTCVLISGIWHGFMASNMSVLGGGA
jgi:hypothetical protein